MAPSQAAEVCQQYELLRQHALAPNAVDGGWGLVILLRQGLAAWMEAWAAQPPLVLGPVPGTPPGPAGQDRDWVLALAALVLGDLGATEVRHG